MKEKENCKYYLNGFCGHLDRFETLCDNSPCDDFVFRDEKFTAKKALSKQIGGNHYKRFRIQPIEFFMANKIPYAEAAICKYAIRHSFKGKGKEDLEKIKHLCDILIEEFYPKNGGKSI